MHITVKVVATDSAVAALSVAIAVTLMCTSLSQHCHYHCSHSAVPVFAVTALCTSVCDCYGIYPVYYTILVRPKQRQTLTKITCLKSNTQVTIIKSIQRIYQKMDVSQDSFWKCDIINISVKGLLILIPCRFKIC